MRTVNFDGATVTPSKILCVGRNYVAHIEELGNEVPEEMVVFGKPNSAIGAALHSRLAGEQLHYEGEIALLVAEGRAVAAGFGLDLTKRGLQARLKDSGLPWERAKAFDGAALFSAFTAIDDPGGLSLQLLVNGELRQSGGVELMMYPPEEILAQLGEFTSLEDGDIVMTGTPAGVGPVHAGDHFTGRLLQDSRLLLEHSWQAI